MLAGWLTGRQGRILSRVLAEPLLTAQAKGSKGARYLTTTASVTNSRKSSAIQDLQIWLARESLRRELCTGRLAPNDSTELHNLPLVIHVRLKKRADTGELSNEIKGYSKKESPPPAAQPAAANGTPPWKRSPQTAQANG